MELFGRELTIKEVIALTRMLCPDARGKAKCQDCMILEAAETLADEVENRRGAPENKPLTVTLPCKVGDAVYYIAWHETQPIKHGDVWQFGMDGYQIWASVSVSKTGVVIVDVNNLYLTRKAAEQALAARRPEAGS